MVMATMIAERGRGRLPQSSISLLDEPSKEEPPGNCRGAVPPRRSRGGSDRRNAPVHNRPFTKYVSEEDARQMSRQLPILMRTH
jgi:hypothetical protein